jgi:hypothetical protein
MPVRLPDGRAWMLNAKEEWTLSADGKTLTQKTSFSDSDPNMSTEATPLIKVFDKVP